MHREALRYGDDRTFAEVHDDAGALPVDGGTPAGLDDRMLQGEAPQAITISVHKT